MRTAFRKRILFMGLAFMTFTLSGATSFAENRLEHKGTISTNKANKKDYPNMAKVTLQDAVSTALKHVPGKATEAELESKDGSLVYEVTVMSPDKKETEVYVDAGNAAILGRDKESGMTS